MGEPTIPEAAVEAAGMGVAKELLHQFANPSEGGWDTTAIARAALAAAEPLMHEGHHAVIERLYAEIAELRDALEKVEELLADICPYFTGDDERRAKAFSIIAAVLAAPAEGSPS